MINGFVILALLAAPGTAPTCVTKRQIADAAMVLAPYVVEAVTDKCRPHLAADTFLVAKGDALHARLKAEGVGREASAGAAVMAIMGPEVPPVKDTASLVAVMGSMASGLMAKDLPVAHCAELSGIMEALAPLPAENFGMIAASMAGIISEEDKDAPGKAAGEKGKPKFEICAG
jgi:hypothetical protein